MTRPKADSDPWLTDPISRDRVIAKTVVEGMRTIIGLLRDIRDSAGETNRVLLRENQMLREQLIEAYRQTNSSPVVKPPRRDYPPCEKVGCPLPLGHSDPHRGSLRSAV